MEIHSGFASFFPAMLRDFKLDGFGEIWKHITGFQDKAELVDAIKGYTMNEKPLHLLPLEEDSGEDEIDNQNKDPGTDSSNDQLVIDDVL